MKAITKFFLDKNILFKALQKIDNKRLGTKKRMDIYVATSIKKEYYAIFLIEGKSRFLQKNVSELYAIYSKLIELQGHNFKKKELIITSPLCSKAKQNLEEQNWSVYCDFM